MRDSQDVENLHCSQQKSLGIHFRFSATKLQPRRHRHLHQPHQQNANANPSPAHHSLTQGKRILAADQTPPQSLSPIRKDEARRRSDASLVLVSS